MALGVDTAIASRLTLVRKRCASCRRTTSFDMWPWSGRMLVTSHGLCRSCLRRMRRSVSRWHGEVVVSDRLC